MPVDTGGPVTGQNVKVYRGAPKTVGATISDPTGAYSVPGVIADWWAAILRPPTAGGTLAPTIAGVPGAAHKTGLAVTTPTPGVVSVTWVIEPVDIASLQPNPFYDKVQHEIWLTAPGGEAQPVLIGSLAIVETVRDAAST